MPTVKDVIEGNKEAEESAGVGHSASSGNQREKQVNMQEEKVTVEDVL
jgi:hypothetical protein